MQLIVQLRDYKPPLINHHHNYYYNSNNNNVVKVKVVKNGCKKLGGYNPPEKRLNYY